MTATPLEALRVKQICTLWEAIGTYSVQCATTGELAPSKLLVDAVAALSTIPPEPTQAVQGGDEPVAYRHLHEDGWEYYDAPTGSECKGCEPLYTRPQAAQSLTDDQCLSIREALLAWDADGKSEATAAEVIRAALQPQEKQG